jgi:DNA-directed RNA polymerase alpha subunit
MPAPRLADLDGEGYGRTLAPLIKAGLADIEAVALLTAGQLLEIKGIGAKTSDTVRQMLADHALTLADETTPVGKVA